MSENINIFVLSLLGMLYSYVYDSLAIFPFLTLSFLTESWPYPISIGTNIHLQGPYGGFRLYTHNIFFLFLI